MNGFLRRVLAPVFFLSLSTAAFAEPPPVTLPPVDNLQQQAADAQAAGKPLVLMFSLPECPYCKVVRRNYLGPLLREANPPVIRELTMTSRQSIHDYDGSWTTPTAIAKRYGVAVAPTLVFVDAAGDMLVEPLVGGDHQFYVAYLDRAFDESHKKLAARKQRNR
jgi:thioredoxin-related protein